MKKTTKFILMLLSAASISGFYRGKQKGFLGYSISPTTQELDKRKTGANYEFFPKILVSNYYINNDDFQVSSEQETELKMYILPSWLISKNFKNGFPNCIVFSAE